MHTETVTIAKAEDITQLEGKALVKFFNQITGEQVKKFADRATGLKRATEAFNAFTGEKPINLELIVTGSEKPEVKEGSDTAKDTQTGNEGTTDMKPRAATKGGARRKGGAKGNTETSRARKTFDLKPHSKIKEHRPDTARAKAVDVLKKGATFEQVQKATGWKKHRHCYEGIRLLNTHLGWGIKEDTNGKITIFAK